MFEKSTRESLYRFSKGVCWNIQRRIFAVTFVALYARTICNTCRKTMISQNAWKHWLHTLKIEKLSSNIERAVCKWSSWTAFVGTRGCCFLRFMDFAWIFRGCEFQQRRQRSSPVTNIPRSFVRKCIECSFHSEWKWIQVRALPYGWNISCVFDIR